MLHRSTTRFILESVEGLFLVGSIMLSWPISRYWLKHWGATYAEQERIWPGDALVSPGYVSATRAISVEAPAQEVWKWVVQIGLERAGFYSYELLERVVNIPVTNVESIEESLQQLKPGDSIYLHPKAPSIPVAIVDAPHQLCFGEIQPSPNTSSDKVQRSWCFYMEERGESACRLIVRGCVRQATHASLLARLGEALVSPLDLAMEQRMLRTIRRLAEASTGRAT